MEKSYRIHTNIISDTVLNVNLQQDYDFLEVLSLKLRTSEAYRLHSSSYGVIIGRVLANDAFGIPNARISVFIEKDENDPTYMESVYPYSEITTRDKYGRRYNLLPDYDESDCYRIVGTFPNKRLVLDDDITLEVYDKYYKFTTVTNTAGDYMIFGVPSGNQQVHVDLDLSNIGMLSQTPLDFKSKGYNMSMFDSPTQFKESTALESLAQIYTQDKSVFVYPFWGDSNLDNGIVAITRCDVQVQYKFEPSCVFLGSIVSDNESNSINHICAASKESGRNEQLVTGEGTIEMIRKTQDGLVEEFPIQGNQLIDSDGVWCYQIPMNLDYLATDEYGNIVPTDNPSKGIPTRTQVRFRISKSGSEDNDSPRHTAKYLVPMNPTFVGNKPKTAENGEYIDKMYIFGSNTPDDCFRDLYWNNIYSVKNFIPKVQLDNSPGSANHVGIKAVNFTTDQNQMPFNNIRIDVPISYILLCLLFALVRAIVQFVNLLIVLINEILGIIDNIRNICIPWVDVCPFKWIPSLCCFGCISLGGGLSDNNTAYYPGCVSDKSLEASSCPEEMEDCKKENNPGELLDLVQQKLATDFKMVSLDFQEDWINGTLYMPLWFWKKPKKFKFLFFTITYGSNTFCDCDRKTNGIKVRVACSSDFDNKYLDVSDGAYPENGGWHKKSGFARTVHFSYGLIKNVINKNGLNIYYYGAVQPTKEEGLKNMKDRDSFYAVRLFATDIILLGNLNENNLYGLPQLFKALPATTSNIPPIATVITYNVENAEDNDDNDDSDNELLGNNAPSGNTSVTGMDWEDGGGNIDKENGLFFELSCIAAASAPKTCINLQRMCELGMNLDMSHPVMYTSSEGLRWGNFYQDGLITKYELEENQYRAMFATMNHLGFVPQTYQDTKTNFNETQILDENTNYYIPKFKFLYPTDLDGRMYPLIVRYNHNHDDILTDDKDEAYVNFRLGDVQPKLAGGQFYNEYSLPVYNNSFYFYFGIKRGNTAIEKFQKSFLAPCFKTLKEPFTLDVSSRAASFCPNMYKDDKGKSFITFTSEDIQIPYSYELKDSNGNDVFEKVEDVTVTSVTINDLENDDYTLIITDSNGKSKVEKIPVRLDYITLTYETQGLGVKYYDGLEDGVSVTPMNEICNANEFYGLITFNKIYIDGYEFEIGKGTRFMGWAGPVGERYAIVQVYARTIDENTSVFNTPTSENGFYAADLYLKLNEDMSGGTQDCLCSGVTSSVSVPAFFTGTTLAEKINPTDPDRYMYTFGFNVYKPNTYIAEVIQSGTYCGGQVAKNKSTLAAVVENGKNFNAYLNNMPVKFMIDSGKFYPPQSSTAQLNSWLAVNTEDSFKFPTYAQTSVWKDYINGLSEVKDNSYNKDKIIEYKFKTIFNLSKAVYVSNSGSGNKFTYTAEGGIQPLLYRTFAPNYSDTENMLHDFLYNDNNSVQVEEMYPNIVGNNYNDGSNEDIRINKRYTVNRANIGNYFMVASNNGRYTASQDGDCSIYSQQIPANAPVNIDSDWKKLGSDTIYHEIPSVLYNGGSALCQGSARPYFKAMFVDRRFDYDLVMVGGFPNVPNNATFASETVKTQTTNMRVVGTLYNGIEMAYDFQNNIISAHFDKGTSSYTDDVSGEEIVVDLPNKDKVTRDTSLEYTYEYASGTTSEPRTYLNNTVSPSYYKNYGDNVSQVICDKVISGNSSGLGIYDPSSANNPVFKTYYSATFNGTDVRQLMWSNDTKVLLNEIANSSINNWAEYDSTSSASTSTTLPFYVYNHTSDVSLYNGVFGTGSYPTKRYIDLGKISPKKYLNMEITSCSYSLSLQKDSETKVVSAVMNEGDKIQLNTTFGSLKPSPRGDEEEYGHFIYNLNATSNNFSGNLPISNISLGMNFKSIEYDGFNAYSYPMKLLNMDNVRLLKMASNGGNMLSYYNGLNGLNRVSVNSEIQLRQENNWIINDIINTLYPYSVNGSDNNRLYYNTDAMLSDDEHLPDCRVGCSDFIEDGVVTFNNFCFHQSGGYNGFNLGSNRFVAVCALRDLYPKIEDFSTKHIAILDFSDMYDCGDVRISGTCTFGMVSKAYAKVLIYNDSENEALRFDNIKKYGIMIEEWRTETVFLGSTVTYKYLHFVNEGGLTLEDTSNGFTIETKDGGVPISNTCHGVYVYITTNDDAIYKFVITRNV